MTTLSPLQPELLSLVIRNSRAVINWQALRGDANLLGISRHVQCKIRWRLSDCTNNAAERRQWQLCQADSLRLGLTER